MPPKCEFLLEDELRNRTNDTDLALRELQAYLEGLPYVEGFKKKLEEVTVAEGFYEWTFYLIFSMLNVYVQTQVKCARGSTPPSVAYIEQEVGCAPRGRRLRASHTLSKRLGTHRRILLIATLGGVDP